jgi:His-Xaa-Ser system protein HxsD
VAMSDQGKSLSEFLVDKDELGVYARVCVDPSLYSLTAILKTAYWFTDQCYLYLVNRPPLVEVEFRLKQDDSEDALKKFCGQFLNNLLDQAVRQKVLEETSSVRDTLLKKAFFDAKLSLNHGVVSDESHLPKQDQSFRDDPLNISGLK